MCWSAGFLDYQYDICLQGCRLFDIYLSSSAFLALRRPYTYTSISSLGLCFCLQFWSMVLPIDGAKTRVQAALPGSVNDIGLWQHMRKVITDIIHNRNAFNCCTCIQRESASHHYHGLPFCDIVVQIYRSRKHRTCEAKYLGP